MTSKSEQLLARSHRGGSTIFTQKIILDMLHEMDTEDPSKKRPVYEHLQAAVLTQICYWFSPGKDGQVRTHVEDAEGNSWLAKDPAEWWREIRTTKSQVSYALDNLQSRGLIIRDYSWVAGQNRTVIRLNDEIFAPKYEEMINKDVINPYLKQDKIRPKKKEPARPEQENNQTPDKISPSLEGGSPQVCGGDLPKLGFSSNTRSKDKDHVHRDAEEGSLHSPSNDDLSSANVRTEERSKKDPKRGKKNGKVKTPPAGGGRDRPEPKRKEMEKKASPETAFLCAVHDKLTRHDRKYAAAAGKEPQATEELLERAAVWLGMKDLVGADMTDDNEQERLVYWFCKTYKPGMGDWSRSKSTSLRWVLNETTAGNFLSAREALLGSREKKEDWRPRFKGRDPVRLKDDGRIGRVVRMSNVTGEMLFTVRLEDGTEIEGRKQDEMEKIGDGRFAGAYIN